MLLIALTALVLLSSVVFASRLWADRLAAAYEVGLASVTIALGVIEGVIYLLGWTDQLDLYRLVGLTTGICVVLIALALAGVDPNPRSPLAVTRAPFDLLASLARARSVSFLAMIWVLGLALWTLYLSWLAPSGAWDGLWYHEPMVGFAIQNRGFAIVEVPAMMEQINGYPRGGENLMLWLVMLLDRRLIDAVPSFMILIALLAVYSLARRHGSQPALAMGLACVAVTVPGAALQLRSTYIDVTVLAAMLAGTYWVTQPQLRARDIWMAGISLGVLGASKSNGMVFATLLGGWLLFSCLLAIRRAPLLLLHWVLAGVVVALYAAPTYVRNVVLHDNPLWPLTYASERLGIRFVGTIPADAMQRTLEHNVAELWGEPTFGENFHDTGRHAYGFAMSFIGLPLFVIAFAVMSVRWVMAALARPPDGRLLAGLTSLAVCVVFGVGVQLASPGHHWSRFSLAFPALGLVLIGWWVSHDRRRGFIAEALVGAMISLHAVTLAWDRPGWDVSVSRAFELMRQPPDVRLEANTSHCLWSAEARRERERVVRAGELVVFTDGAAFPGNAWNEEMSNRVLYIPYGGRAQFLERLSELAPRMAYVVGGSVQAHALESAGWRLFAPGSFDTVVYVPPGPEGGALGVRTGT